MNNRIGNCFRFISVIPLLCLTAAIPVDAQGNRITQNAQGMQQQRDPLASLKQALSNAGASALDSSQQTALNTLITKIQNTNGPARPDPGEKAALDAYTNAIFAKDLGSATKAAGTLVNFLIARQRKMMEMQTGFAIQALSCLHRDQVAAMQTKMGKNGIVFILGGLALPAISRAMTGAAMLGPSPQMRPGNIR